MTERAKAAWRQLADRFDPPRAAWVARALKPLNPADRPANPVAGDQPLPKPPRFPSPAPKAEAWTRAPLTRVLPNHWIVLGYKNGRLVVNVKGGRFPDTLPTGPDPSADRCHRRTAEQLAIDDGMKWMVDFDAAEQVGMGIRARLTSERRCRRVGLCAGAGHQGCAWRHDRLDAAAGGIVRRPPLHRRAELRAAGHTVKQHGGRAVRLSARQIPATRRAIWPNAPRRPFNPATDRTPMC